MKENCDMQFNFSIDFLNKVSVKDLKSMFLFQSSWHHSSSMYNRVDFYSLDKYYIDELTDGKINKRIEIVKEIIVTEQQEIEEEWECEYLVWSGSRKHPKATKVTAIGIIRGEWFHLKDGTKKKTSANGFVKKNKSLLERRKK
jgi:hypothetical protein